MVSEHIHIPKEVHFSFLAGFCLSKIVNHLKSAENDPELPLFCQAIYGSACQLEIFHSKRRTPPLCTPASKIIWIVADYIITYREIEAYPIIFKDISIKDIHESLTLNLHVSIADF